MDKMLVNATLREELRVAVLKNNKLDDLDIQRIGVEQKKSNIYKGKITRLEPSLGAAFIDFGAERHGFLPIKEIEKSYFQIQTLDKPISQYDIKELLRENQEVLVQVDKEERGNKGAALTTFISLAGSYLVLMPNNPRAGGISRRIDGRDRDELRDVLNQLTIPEDMGVIIRTAGTSKTKEELQWDLDNLLQHWDTIKKAAVEHSAPCLIHKESDVVIRALRDYLRSDIEEIIIDSEEVYNNVKNYLQQVRPNFVEKVKFYQDKTPLFSLYKIEKQIETAYQRKVTLPSGGSIVIDPTEALVSIDVNSAKATSGKDIEETAYATNLEAADEIARQLRLRDIGGLIVIDFIDMLSIQNQREVANHLREALRTDRARVRIGVITKFGLLEMSRQRLHPTIEEAVSIPCPRCDGQGTIRSIHSLALSVMRILDEEASTEKTAQLQAYLPVELATYMLNEKREDLNELELRQGIRILIIPNQYLQTPKYRIKRLKTNELPHSARNIASYKLIEAPKTETPLTKDTSATSVQFEQPAVGAMLPTAPAPISSKKPSKPGLISRLLKSLFGSSSKNEEKTTTKPTNKPYYHKSRYPYHSSRYKGHKPHSNYARRGTRGGKPKSG